MSSSFFAEEASAGFYLGYLRELRERLVKSSNISIPDLRTLSVFKFKRFGDGNQKISRELGPLVAVYRNLLARGEPTLPSLFVERTLLASVGHLLKVKETNRAGSVRFGPEAQYKEAKEEDWYLALAKAHYIVEPRLKDPLKALNGTLDSEEERLFISSTVPEVFGKHTWQIVEPQRPLSTLTKDNEIFSRQRVDFSYESTQWKLVFEVDGDQHNDNGQSILDKKRDTALQEAGWKVVRLSAAEVRQGTAVKRLSKAGEALADDPMISLTGEIYNKPLWETKAGLEAMKLVLSPFAIARIQRVLLDALESGALDLNASLWNILIIERDVPCSKLAIIDFIQHLSALLSLSGREVKLPSVKLTVLNTREFSDADEGVTDALLKEHRISFKKEFIGASDGFYNADVCLDISMLQKENFADPGEGWYKDLIKASGSVYILRGVHSHRQVRKIATESPIMYKIDHSKEETLRFFLQNIFRKETFREGQFDVIRRALGLKPVIALLPTGAGKSICYQMAALLQPGITIVVDPLKTLMLDQAENLKAAGIDCVEFINSDQTVLEREEVVKNFDQGRYQIIFVSPERFQIGEFRSSLAKVTVNNLIPYLVIDEAHCVSEWGHDFRTSYLNLARNARKYCKHNGFEPVVLALTGTASFVVLSDVQREIGVDDEESKIQPATFDRKELNFEIEKVPSTGKEQKLMKILNKLPERFGKSREEFFKPNSYNTCSGLIFTQHVNANYGVYEICGVLRSSFPGTRIEFFSGEVPKVTDRFRKTKTPVMSSEEFDKYKRDTQLGFKNNEFPVLVATKAFGMGIDKPNIRYTIHYGIPQSLEAYYQEAGRAGRDREDAVCTIIFSDDDRSLIQKYFDPNVDADKLADIQDPGWNDRGDICRMMHFHKNSFRGANTEKREIKELLSSYIGKHLSSMKTGERKTVEIPYSWSNEDRGNKEKSIYRLSSIGLVEDYTIDYNRKQFVVEICRKTDDGYIKALQEYVGRYKTEEYVENVPYEVASEEGNGIIEKAVCFLIRFVYDEIERKRRRALQNIAEVARSSANGEDIRRALLDYLESSPFTGPLQEILRKVDPAQWWEILSILEGNDDVDTARQLLGGCRRFLESSPDHPGLLLLSGVGNLAIKFPNLDAGFSAIKTGLKELLKNGYSKVENVGSELVERVARIMAPKTNSAEVMALLGETVLDVIPTRRIAREVYKYCPEKAQLVIMNEIAHRVKKFNDGFIGVKR